MDFVIFKQLGIGLALGTLIGLERERRLQIGQYDSSGGIRTFALIGMMGALAYILGFDSGMVFAMISGGFLALLITGYVLSFKKYGNLGITSEISSILVYMIGILCGMQKYVVATTVALVVLVALLFKEPLHKWARQLRDSELISTLQFIIIAFVVLPLLPNQTYGPYDFFNPYLVWLMVVFISGISFVSYIAIRVLGAKRGILATGFLAGFISSTALAFSFSAESKRNPDIVNPYVIGMVIAGTAMFFRVLLEVAVLNYELMKFLVLPIIAMAVTGIAALLYFWYKGRRIPKVVEKEVLQIRSPFSLWPALKFGAFFALILFFSKFAVSSLGDRGLYLTSFFSGILDVDAITISMSNLAGKEVMQKTAVTAILIASIVNTMVKGLIFIFFGGMKVAKRVLAVFLLMALVGLGALFLI